MAYELPGQRSETVRRANLSAILRELHNRGPVSRSELGTRTGLTRSAVRGLIGELALAGLVTEERGTPQGTPGRPSPLVRPSPRCGIVLALEITVDSLAVAAVAIGGEVLDVVRLDRPRDRGSVDETVADLAALARAVLRRLPDTDGMIGIGVGVVGIVRRDAGVVTMAPNLGWRDVPLAERLADALGTSLPIAVANEADLGALAELRRGAAMGAQHVLFLSGEVGVGGGLIIDGQPLTGARGFAGEVGHMPVNPDGRTCRCGSVGCWETEVGEGALLRRAGHPPDAGREEVEAVLSEAAAGAPDVLEALDAVGRWPASSTSSTRRWWSSAGSSAASIPSWRRGCRASSIGSRSRRRARRSGCCRPRSATTPRSSAPPSWPSSRCSPTRPFGHVPPWRRPESRKEETPTQRPSFDPELQPTVTSPPLAPTGPAPRRASTRARRRNAR
jgi:predicted NBD/HSP70 family sugar kinase